MMKILHPLRPQVLKQSITYGIRTKWQRYEINVFLQTGKRKKGDRFADWSEILILFLYFCKIFMRYGICSDHMVSLYICRGHEMFPQQYIFPFRSYRSHMGHSPYPICGVRAETASIES